VRFAVVVELPVEVGNAFEKDPKAEELLTQFLEQAKPEAGYFGSARRLLILIVNAESHEELSGILVPLWHLFKTYPQVEPVVTIEEFKAGFPKWKQMLKDL